MWRATALVCLLSSSSLQTALSKCTANSTANIIETLQECWAGNTEALACIDENSTEASILECLQNRTTTVTETTVTVTADTPATNFSSVEEWFAAQQWRYFKSGVQHDGSDVYLNYVTVTGTGDKGAMLVVHGNGENLYNYPVIKYFVDEGYSPIFAYSHRGMGTSDRLLDDHFKLHVVASDDFVKDCRTFIDLVREELAESSENNDKPFYLYCHSLGCAVSLTYMIQEYRAGREQYFNAVVLQAPLIKADTDPFPYDVAVALGETMVFFGQGEEYAPTKDKTFEEWYPADASDCTAGSLSRCTRRLNLCIDSRYEEFGHDGHTGLCVGGVTANMAKEFFDLYADTFEGFMAQDGKKIVPPLLLQQSGPPDGTDKLVVNAVQDQFCSNSAKDCTMLPYPNALHNLAKETDEVLFDFLEKADEFYQSHKDMVVPQEPITGYKLQGEECYDDLECISGICDGDWAFDIAAGSCTDPSVVDAASWASCSMAVLTASAAALVFSQA
ncbi:unnamed protein product [Prorocentrum cordatum]|uniref:Serine aminopeptidase S33 domain-containing protein n=1 Tax=Prorocentrum cordatum TaxID=2364126 RepID=A0ABN9QJ77_9DINO|nr:unnamed protein product [Polarella glacialis]